MNRTVYGRNAKKNLLYPLSLICFTFGKPFSSLTSHVIDLVDIVATVQISLSRSLSRSSSSSSLLALSDSYTLSLLATGWWVMGRLFLLFSGCGEFQVVAVFYFLFLYYIYIYILMGDFGQFLRYFLLQVWLDFGRFGLWSWWLWADLGCEIIFYWVYGCGLK